MEMKMVWNIEEFDLTSIGIKLKNIIPILDILHSEKHKNCIHMNDIQKIIENYNCNGYK